MKKGLLLGVIWLACCGTAHAWPSAQEPLIPGHFKTDPCSQSFATFPPLAKCAIRDYGRSDNPRRVTVTACHATSPTRVICTLDEYGEPLIDPSTFNLVRRNVQWRVVAELVHRHGLAVYVNLTTGGYPFYEQLESGTGPLPVVPLFSYPAV